MLAYVKPIDNIFPTVLLIRQDLNSVKYLLKYVLKYLPLPFSLCTIKLHFFIHCLRILLFVFFSRLLVIREERE